MSHNHEAEAAVCGALLFRPEQVDECQEVVSPSDFTHQTYRSVYSAILELHDAGSEIDTLTVADKVGDIALIGSLAANAPLGAAKAYATIVRDKSKLRQLARAWQEANQIISDETVELSARVEFATDILSNAIKHESVESKTLTGRDLFTVWYNDLERLSNIGDSITGISSGFPDLDKHTKGFHGGEMLVIAARPGCGKTNLAINLTWAAVKQGKHVLYVSLEMSKTELMHRFAAQAMAIDYEKVQSAQLGDADVGAKLSAFMAMGLKMPLHINDRSGHTMATIRSEAKKTRRKHGLDMIVIDHIGLISGKADSLYMKMTDISRQIKLLAKELDVPVLALTQLNRAVEQRPDPRPKLSDLRDSGAIEQDADGVMFPFRDTDPDADEESQRYGQLIIAKLRHGKIGIVPLLVQFNHCRFLSADRSSLTENWMLTSSEKKVKAEQEKRNNQKENKRGTGL